MRKYIKMLLGFTCTALLLVVAVALVAKPKDKARVEEGNNFCAVELGGERPAFAYDPSDPELNVTQKSWEYSFINSTSNELLIKLMSTPTVNNMMITYGYSQDKQTDANAIEDTTFSYRDTILNTTESINIYIIAKVIDEAEPASFAETVNWQMGKPVAVTYDFGEGNTDMEYYVQGAEVYELKLAKKYGCDVYVDNDYSTEISFPVVFDRPETLFVYEIYNLPTDWLRPIDEDEDGHNDYYEVFRGTTPLPSMDLTIPSIYKGLPVKTIYSADITGDMPSDAVFLGMELTSVRLSANTTKIGAVAFNGCTSLTSINIPASVEEIELGAFAACENLTSVTFEPDSRLKVLGNGAFANTGLESITIPYSVTTLGTAGNMMESELDMGPFAGCANLAEVNFAPGSQLETIGMLAFMYCQSLTYISIPANVKDISFAAFAYAGLNQVDFAKNAKLESIGNAAFAYVPFGEEMIILPASLKYIGSEEGFMEYMEEQNDEMPFGAFQNCENLGIVLFEKGSQLEYVGPGTFGQSPCAFTFEIPLAGITTIDDLMAADEAGMFGDDIEEIIFTSTMPDSLTEIGMGAFMMTELMIMNFSADSRLQTVGSMAFMQSGLYMLNLPSSLQYLGVMALGGCENLEQLTMPGIYTTNMALGEEAIFEGCTSLSTINFIDGGVGRLPSGACYGMESLTTVTISAGITAIDDFAFYQCSNLSSVTFAEGSQLIEIAAEAFAYCTALTSFEMPSAVMSIGYYAFHGCSNTAFNMRNLGNFQQMHPEAFGGCDVSLNASQYSVYNNGFYVGDSANPYTTLIGIMDTSVTTFTIHNDTKYVTMMYGMRLEECSNITYTQYDNAYYLGSEANPYMLLVKAINTSITSCIIHEDTKVIYAAAFGGCALTSVTIPDGVVNIGMGAFNECQNLTTINISSNSHLESMGMGVFCECKALAGIYLPKNLAVVEGLVIGGSLAYWLWGSFSECISLTEFVVHEDNQYFSSIDGVIYNKDKTLLIKCPAATSLTELQIPDTVRVVETFALIGKVVTYYDDNGNETGSDVYSCVSSIIVPASVRIFRVGSLGGIGLTNVVLEEDGIWCLYNGSDFTPMQAPAGVNLASMLGEDGLPGNFCRG